MDELVREIREKIEECRQKGRPAVSKKTGEPVSLFETRYRGTICDTEIPNTHFSRPPVDFEKKSGLTGIAGQYHMPAGLTPSDVQTYSILIRNLTFQEDYTVEECLGKLTELHQALIGRNSQMEQIRYNPLDPHTVFDIILGVASGFNIKDIQHYIDGNNWSLSMKDPKYKELYEKIDSQAHIYWVPCMETLKEMDRQLSAAPLFSHHGNKPRLG